MYNCTVYYWMHQKHNVHTSSLNKKLNVAYNKPTNLKVSEYCCGCDREKSLLKLKKKKKNITTWIFGIIDRLRKQQIQNSTTYTKCV